MESTPGVMIQGQNLSWDQMIPVFMISDRPDIKEEDKPLTLLLLLWDFWWSETRTLKYHDVQGLLYAIRNPDGSDQGDKLNNLRGLYVLQNNTWKEQQWQIYKPVVSSAPEMLRAVKSMEYEDFEVVVFSLTFTRLTICDVVLALQCVRQQRGFSLPAEWRDRLDKLVAFMADYAQRVHNCLWSEVIDMGDEGKANWIERLKGALKVDEIAMNK
ncbi:MAG: hypothetical protein Q9183_001761 [Haloplaca sp. 2 TL-2023]